MSENGFPIRLNKYFSIAGICSRREADRWIADGQVTVNGKIAQAGQKICADDVICVRGQEISRKERARSVVLAVHKPRGVVCTDDTRFGDKRLIDLVSWDGHLFPIGRLDKDSEGLILMTNRGDLADAVMRARNYHEKEYVVTVDQKIDPGTLRKLAKGVYLQELDVTTRPCKVFPAGERTFHIILTQGLNRQIRRMCFTFGYHVVRLKRIRVMNITLGTLPAGSWRELDAQEVSQLERLAFPETSEF